MFGAGKSHLLVVIILCLSRLFEECGSTLRILVGTLDPTYLLQYLATHSRT